MLAAKILFYVLSLICIQALNASISQASVTNQPRNISTRPVVFQLSVAAGAQAFLNSSSQIPQRLIEMGFERIGQLDLQKLVNEISRVSVKVRPWVSVQTAEGSTRYWTSFIHDSNRAEVEVNATLFFALEGEAAEIVALNACLSALGYNDLNYQMSIALWFFTRPEFRSTLSTADFNYALKLARKICVRLPDTSAEANNNQVHYLRIVDQNADMPSFGNLAARGITIFTPVEDLGPQPGGSLNVETTPQLPISAAKSGGGDWGGILMKQSMIDAAYEKRNSQPSEKSKVLDNFRLTMVMDFEVNWQVLSNH